MTLRDLLEELRGFLAVVWKGLEPVVTDFMEVITWQTNWLDAHLDCCRCAEADPLRAATGGSGMALEEKTSHQVPTKCAD